MASTKALPGSHLLAALHAAMERMKSCVKVSRAASKKPQTRNNVEINYILAETQTVQLLASHGPGVHRDLCHVLQYCSLGEMSSFRLPGEHPHGLLIYVMQGRIQVRTRSQFKPALSTDDSSSKTVPSSSKSPHVSSSGGSKAVEGNNDAAGASEADLRALFNSIDVDGSGAIDVEELQYALEVMGIQKTAADVQELMDSVDKDGSGQLEFEEFVLILKKLGGVSQEQSSWQELADDTWALDIGQGTCLGAAALRQGLAQEGLIVALEDADLLLLDGNVYSRILTTGFDGQLTAKMNILRSCPTLSSSLNVKSDLRGLAYVGTAVAYSWGSRVYAAGQPCLKGAVYVIQEGSCRVIGRVRGAAAVRVTTSVAALAVAEAAGGGGAGHAHALTDSSAEAAAAALLASPRHRLRTPRARVTDQQVELAVVGPGDIIGEAALLGLTAHASSAVVSTAHLSALKLQVTDLQQLMHPADLQALQTSLRQRDADRNDRLTAAASAASILHMQSQHVRGIAAASAAAHQERCTMDCTLQNGQYLAGQQRGADTLQGLGSPRGSSCSGRGSSNGGSGAPAGSCVSGEAALRLLLPSSGAGAASALAARGEVHPSCLPSKAAQAEVDAVTQLLSDLVGAKEDMQAAQAAVIAATTAALASVGHGSTADVFSLARCSTFGTSEVSSIRATQTMPGAFRSSSMRDAAAAAAASAPGAVAGTSGLNQQQEQGPFTSAHTLLPDRLVAKLQQAVSECHAGSKTLRHTHNLKLPKTGHASARGRNRNSGSRQSRIEGGVGPPGGGQQQQQQRRGDEGEHSQRSTASVTADPANRLDYAMEAKQQQLLQAQSSSRLHSPYSSKGVARGLAVTAACSSNQPDCFFLQTGGACVGGGPQAEHMQDAANAQQQRQVWAGCAQGSEPGGSGQQRSRTQGEQPGGSLCLTPAPLGLPVLAPEAVAMAQQQLAACSISLPTPRSSRHKTPAHKPCSGAGAFAVVSLALTCEAAAAAAAAGGEQMQQRGSSTGALPALTPGRLKTSSCNAGAARNSSGGTVTAGRGNQAAVSAAASSSARRSSVAQLYSVYLGSPAEGRLSSPSLATAGGQEAARAWGSATGRGSMKQARWSVAGPWAGEETGPTQTSGSEANWDGSGNASSSNAGTKLATPAGAGASPVGQQCTSARPVAGGLFVELDGPAWDAAASAADTASWCISSRTIRQRHSPAHSMTSCQAHAAVSGQRVAGQTVKQAESSSSSQADAGHDASLASAAAALVATAQDLLSHPLPPGSMGSGCRPSTGPLSPSKVLPGMHLSADGRKGAHLDQGLPAQQLQQQSNWGAAGKGRGMSVTSRSRPHKVPKLQLATMHIALQIADSSLSKSPVSGSACAGSPKQGSTAGVTGGLGSISWPVGSPRVAVGCSRSSDGALAVDQQQATVLPPALPAFTPRRVWAPGGSRGG